MISVEAVLELFVPSDMEAPVGSPLRVTVNVSLVGSFSDELIPGLKDVSSSVVTREDSTASTRIHGRPSGGTHV